ncbi:glycosyltransferase family 4 protein [Acinetobacter sp. GSS19]|uniref:glycosyltransferase family 4 protein n=1 Tax=Acinetobacter sp. GSS19 TaxID=3020716 RepID=UPI00235F9826|nr:glycosyltransferase family 4 protein [Acinetobacter sp. GSS19]
MACLPWSDYLCSPFVEEKVMTNKLKIVNTVYGDASGGRWQAMLNTHDALASHGHEMWIVAGDENKHLNVGERQFFSLNSSGFYDLVAAFKLNRWLRQVRPDVIIAHSGRAVYLFKNAMLFGGIKAPVLAMNHSHNVKRTVRADGFIHITPHVKSLVEQAAKKKGIHIEDKPQAIISNLVYLPEQEPEFKPLGSLVTLGMMTRLVDYKGTHILIDAVALLKVKGYQMRLLVAGDGEEKDNLIAQIQHLKLENEVQFLGWIKGEQKTQFYHDVDIIVVPTMNDTQPLAILDAFAWGKPVVASDHISVQQIIRHGENGLMARQNDAENLAEKIIYLIDHPEKLKSIAVTGYQDALQKYQFKKIEENLNKFVSEVY